MNGVLIHDYLRDLLAGEAGSPLPYAEVFYARYPCVSLGYHPPAVPIVEACVYAILGVSLESARIANLLFSLVGAYAFFRLLERMGGSRLAGLGSLLLWSAPLILRWNRGVMLDVPTIAMLSLTADLTHRALLDRSRLRPALLAALGATLAAYTKQTAGYGALLLPAGLLLSEGWGALRTRRFWLPPILFAILLIPLLLMTLTFGKTNLTHNVGSGGDLSRLSFEGLTYYIVRLPRMLGWGGVGLALIGLVLASRRLEKPEKETSPEKQGLRLLLLWGVLNLVFMTLVSYKSPRLGMLWLPALAGLAALPLDRLAARGKRDRLLAGGLALLVAGMNLLSTPLEHVAGFGEIAKQALAQCRGDTLLYNGFHNGTFVFHIRRLDPEGKRVVLRGSKSLALTRVMARFGGEQLLHTPEEIRAFLAEQRTGLVLMESTNLLELPTDPLLHAALETGWERLPPLAYCASRPDLEAGSPLLLFRPTDPLPPTTNRTLRLRFLTTGETITVHLGPP